MSMGGGIISRTNAKSSSIRAVIIRADGRVEDRGLIAFWHRNPLIRMIGNIFIFLKEKSRW